MRTQRSVNISARWALAVAVVLPWYSGCMFGIPSARFSDPGLCTVCDNDIPDVAAALSTASTQETQPTEPAIDPQSGALTATERLSTSETTLTDNDALDVDNAVADDAVVADDTLAACPAEDSAGVVVCQVGPVRGWLASHCGNWRCLGLFCHRWRRGEDAMAEAALQPSDARFFPVPTGPVFAPRMEYGEPQLMMAPVPHHQFPPATFVPATEPLPMVEVSPQDVVHVPLAPAPLAEPAAPVAPVVPPRPGPTTPATRPLSDR